MSVKLDIERGGEWLLATARTKLKVLRRWADTAGIQTAIKWIAVTDGSTIFLRTTRFAHDTQDLIRIRSGLRGGFIVYPAATKLTAPFTVFSYSATQEVMPVANTGIEAFPGYGPISMKYRRSGATLTEASSSSPQLGYFHNQAFTPVTIPFLTITDMPFVHHYADPDTGDPATKVLLIRPHTNNPSVFEVGVAPALGSSGAATFSIDDLSFDGRIGIGLEGSMRMRYEIDYALATPVVKSEESVVYGTSTEHHVLTATPAVSYHETLDHTESADLVICYGFDAEAAVVFPFVRRALATAGTRDIAYAVNPNDRSGSVSASGSETLTLVTRDGIEVDFAEKSYAWSASGPNSGSGSASGAYTTRSLEILYADASLEVVIFRHTVKVYDLQLSVVDAVVIDSTSMMHVSVDVNLLLAGVQTTIFTEELDEASDAAYNLYAGVPSAAGALGSNLIDLLPTLLADVDETTPADVVSNTYAVKARLQAAPLAFAAQSRTVYVGQYTHTDDSTHIFGSGTPRQALIDRLTGILEAKEAAEPPTITAEEQLFLDAMRAGTLDDYALKLAKPSSQFGISLI